MTGSLTLTELIVPLALVLGGLLVGVLCEKLIIAGMTRLAARARWRGAGALAESLRGVVRILGVLVGAAAAVLSLRLDPGLAALMMRGIVAVAILTATILAARLAGGLVGAYTRGDNARLPATSLLTNTARTVVLLLGLMIVVQSTFGIDMGPVLAALGVGGIAIALALQDTLSNLFAGFYVILTRNLRPGDYVQLDSGQEGFIADISWRNTSIRSQANTMIIVPNAKLASAIVTNFAQPGPDLALEIPVSVSTSGDRAQLEAAALAVAQEVMQSVPGGVPEFKPFIRYNALAEARVTLHVVMRARTFVDQDVLRHEFIKRLLERYQVEDLEVAKD